MLRKIKQMKFRGKRPLYTFRLSDGHTVTATSPVTLVRNICKGDLYDSALTLKECMERYALTAKKELHTVHIPTDSYRSFLRALLQLRLIVQVTE